MIERLEARVLLSRAWFVATNGNDALVGTLAAPFRTIQRAANLAQPGDTVYIRGGVYHETVTPARSGTASAPISFAPYGNESVTIDGADPISGWTNYRGAIYSAPQPWDLGTGNNQVFVDGRMINEARWPNTSLDVSHPATAAISSVSTTSPGNGWLFPDSATLYTPSLPGGTNAWKGATIHIGQGQSWVIQTGSVAASGGGTLTYTFLHLTTYESPQAGDRFYLTGSFQALDSAGEWYRDPGTGRLYLWTPASDSPTRHVIEAKHRQFAFELSGRSFINIRGLHLFASTIDTNWQSSYLNLSGIDARYVSHIALDVDPWDGQNFGGNTGILLNGTHNVLSNSTISYSSGNGVYVNGASNTVQNCTIHDVDYAGGDEAAISVSGTGQQIVGNLIYNAGRDGILATGALGSRINSNTIHDVGLQTTDLGGIYTWGTAGRGTQIAYNSIYNIRTGGFGGDGVYLDNGCSGYLVHDNRVWNVDVPVKFNPPSYNNTIYNDSISYGSQIAAPSMYPKNYYYGSATLTSLGTLGGFRSDANGINDSGAIVGTAVDGAQSDAFEYVNGAMYNLGTLGGTYGIAAAINASGQVAGAGNPPGLPRHAFLYSGGRKYDLGVLPGGIGSSATAINRYGQVAGVCYDQYAVSRAFLYSGGRMINLGTLGGFQSEALSLNDLGVVVGASNLADNRNAHAFYYDYRMWDLGTLGGTSSYALSVNNHNQVVGESLVAGNGAFHAFIFRSGRMYDLGTLPGFRNSVATAINDNGDIVGYAWNADTSTPHAFLIHNGIMRDLNAMIPSYSGWVLQTANALNNKGQIVGAGTDPAGQSRAYVLSVLL